MTYTVKYKRPDDYFWTTIEKVEGDAVMKECAYRFFILEDQSRIEVPLGYLFKFSKERFLVIKKNMEKEAGLKIVTGKDNDSD